jgi:hypothetical protein
VQHDLALSMSTEAPSKPEGVKAGKNYGAHPFHAFPQDADFAFFFISNINRLIEICLHFQVLFLKLDRKAEFVNWLEMKTFKQTSSI